MFAGGAALQGEVSFFEIPSAREALAIEAEGVRAELEELPDFSETRQIDSYGFHGEYLPVLDELPQSPRWTVKLSWGPVAKLEQVILVPAIDPRQGTIRGYGFPRRFRVLKVFPDGSSEVVADWMDEDCPDPGHVPLRIELVEPLCDTIRIDVHRGAEESGREVFALGEVFGVVEHEVWQAKTVEAGPEFEARPYWSKDYLADQKTGLGMPLGMQVAFESHAASLERDFSVRFDEPETNEYVIDFDLGSELRMGWLTLFPSTPPEGSIVPGYGFPGKIELYTGRMARDQVVFRPIRDGRWLDGNPRDNAVRIPLYAANGRWLRLKVSDLPVENGRPVFAMGEVSISMREQLYPVTAIRLEGFPEGAESRVGSLTDGLVGGRPELQMLDWFELIERQNRLEQSLEDINLVDRGLEQRWSQALTLAIMGVVLLFLFIVLVWLIRRRLSLQKLRLRIAEEQHQTEIEQMKLRFFTHISHELRTPLTVIPAPIERAIKEVGEGKLKDYLGVALKNVHELQQLVEQILDLRQIQEGRMRVMALDLELVQHVRSIFDAMQPLAEAKGIDLVFKPAMNRLVACVDPDGIKRILGNLIGNAIKFTPSGGRVELQLRMVDDALVLSVEDTGPGIAAEDLPNIFEQHYRGQSTGEMQTHGSGIGLALVHEVVSLLGGTVQVESPIADGQGSKFTVNLPLKKGSK